MAFTLVAPQHGLADSPFSTEAETTRKALSRARTRRRVGLIPAFIILTVLAFISIFPIY